MVTKKIREYEKEYSKKYYYKHKEEISKRRKIVREQNKDKISERGKSFYQKHKEKILKRQKEYRKNNPEKFKERERRYRLNNPEKVKESRIKCESKPGVKAKRKEYCRKYYQRIKKERNAKIRERKKTDKDFAIKIRLRHLLRHTFKYYTKTGKMWSSSKYGIDYTGMIESLKPFPKDISNYQIDHIKPLCSFNFINKDGSTNLEEIKKAFAPENLQWLTAYENQSKGGTYTPYH